MKNLDKEIKTMKHCSFSLYPVKEVSKDGKNLKELSNKDIIGVQFINKKAKGLVGYIKWDKKQKHGYFDPINLAFENWWAVSNKTEYDDFAFILVMGFGLIAAANKKAAAEKADKNK